MYEAAEYASMHYLVKQTEHLAKRNNPLKDQFKEQIKAADRSKENWLREIASRWGIIK